MDALDDSSANDATCKRFSGPAAPAQHRRFSMVPEMMETSLSLSTSPHFSSTNDNAKDKPLPTDKSGQQPSSLFSRRFRRNRLLQNESNNTTNSTPITASLTVDIS